MHWKYLKPPESGHVLVPQTGPAHTGRTERVRGHSRPADGGVSKQRDLLLRLVLGAARPVNLCTRHGNSKSFQKEPSRALPRLQAKIGSTTPHSPHCFLSVAPAEGKAGRREHSSSGQLGSCPLHDLPQQSFSIRAKALRRALGGSFYSFCFNKHLVDPVNFQAQWGKKKMGQ